MHDTVLVDCVRSVLARHGDDWRLEPGSFWCHARPRSARSRVQGWKLHLSATALSAPLVLAAAAEVLARHGCPFKFAGSLHRVRALGSRQVDRGGGGKIVTAYPDCSVDELRSLAEELHQATRGLPGPGILSDRAYRPGSRVHYRFGGFTGVRMLGNDGGYEAMLVAPDGSLVTDQRKAWFTPPAWAPRDPFAEPAMEGHPDRSTTPRSVLLDGRYVVREVIRHSFTGGVYRATDRHTGAEVIVKQARPHTGSDLTGRDTRDARRHEAAMLSRFADSGVTPRLVGVFEQQGDLFLAQEAISGTTLRQWAARNAAPDDGAGWGPPVDQVCRLAAGLVDLVDRVHAEGLVLRDFNPNNVMVTGAGEVRLIDLEMLAVPGAEVTRAFTPGYAAPEQTRAPDIGPAPAPAADRYSLGATLFHLATGIDPVLADDGPPARPARDRVAAWLARLAAGNPAAHRLADTVVALLDDDPDRRPDLDTVRARVAGADRVPGADRVVACAGPAPAGPGADGPRTRAIPDGLAYLLATIRPHGEERLWPCGESGATTDPLAVQHGAAGVLAVLVAALRAEPRPELRTAVATAAQWIARRLDAEPRVLPGLYFGRSGTAWALLDAGRALAEDGLVDLAVDLARRVPLRWPNPDVCHGAAGAGLTQLRFWEETGQPEFLERARRAADGVAAAARHRDGRVDWPIPADFASGLAGLAHYGFAHGVAGVGAFLLAAGHATGDRGHLDLAVAAADTLAAVVQLDQGAAYWTSDARSTVRKTHWCSGSSGVGTFLGRIWRHTGDDRYGELTAQAALAVYRSRWHVGPAQCHGLAGDADFLLDLAEISGERRYRDWAGELIDAAYLRHALRDGRILAPDETTTTVVPDYATGLAGVLATLLRLRDRTPRMWLPATFTTPDRPHPASVAEPCRPTEPRAADLDRGRGSHPGEPTEGGDPDGTRHRRPPAAGGGRARDGAVALHADVHDLV